jgi:hypothetical protein
MISKTIALLLGLFSSIAFAAGPKPVSCLSSADVKGCLADFAIAALAKERSAELRVDGTESLLSSFAKAGLRRDDLLIAAKDEVDAPIYSRWSLAVARRTYALHHGIDSDLAESPQHIEFLGGLLRKRGDGLDRLWLIWDACEAREGEAPEAIAKWNGTLDRLCTIDRFDVEALEKSLPGISDSALALVAAYNRDEITLKRSMSASLDTLSKLGTALNRKMSPSERAAFQVVMGLGHMFNATALAIHGNGGESTLAIEEALRQLSTVPAFARTSALPLAYAQATWIYAKAYMREKSLASIRKLLFRLDGPRVSSADKATAIGVAIEALQLLESSR